MHYPLLRYPSVCVVLGVLSAALLFGCPPRQVTVPDLKGKTEAEATTVLAYTELNLGFVRLTYDDYYAKGLVCGQEPSAGSAADVGAYVNLYISDGPLMTTVVPRLLGMTEAEAETTLVNGNLIKGTVATEYSETVAAGLVTRQDPAAFSFVTAQSAVDLWISLGPDPRVSVPDVSGMTEGAAETTLIAATLTKGTVGTAYSASVAIGLVISQDPAAGSLAHPSSPVDLILSLGPAPLVSVPDVTGMTEAVAETTLLAADLTKGNVTSEYSNVVAVDLVIRQDPVAGSSIPIHSAVAIVISLGPEPPVTVPNVINMNRAVAESVIAAADLTVGTVIEVFHDTIASGRVTAQNPVSGSSVPPQTAVNLWISKGAEPPVTVPDVTGMTELDAEAALVAVNLTKGTVYRAFSDTVAAGLVISQDPVAGSSVPSNSAIHLNISLGPVQWVSVPDLINLTEAEAEAALIAVGLVKGAVESEYHDTVAAGLVFDQAPFEASNVLLNSAVNIWISLGEAPIVTVPDVTGLTESAAETALIAADLRKGTVTETYSDTVPTGQVICHLPSAGNNVEIDSDIDIWISKGPDPGSAATWLKVYGADDEEYGNAVQVSSGGGYILTGESYDIAGDEDVLLLKTDENGVITWMKSYGDTVCDVGYAVQEASTGGYFIAGMAGDCNTNDVDGLLIKTDAAGTHSWAYTYGTASIFDAYQAMQEVTGGDIVLAGNTNYGVGILLTKTDGDGIEAWTKTITGDAFFVANAVYETKDYGYIIAGGTDPSYNYIHDVYLVKTDSNGTVEWSKTFGEASYDDVAYDVQQTSDEGYIIVGQTHSFGVNAREIYLIKTDVDGNYQWSNTFGGTAYTVGYSTGFAVRELAGGGYIIAGIYNSNGIGTIGEAALIKTDSGGTVIWEKTYGSQGYNTFRDVRELAGGFIAAGSWYDHGTPCSQLLLVKTDLDGNAPATPSK